MKRCAITFHQHMYSGCAQNEAIWKVLDGDNVYSLDFDDVSTLHK